MPDFVSIVGAAAWLPQIAYSLYKWRQRPKLTVIVDRTVQVGYTNLGPIVHIKAFIASSRKDALIDKVTLTVKHKLGERRSLVWTWLRETQADIQLPGGEVMPFSKTQQALALLITTSSPAEKVFTFQDSAFLNDVEPIYGALHTRIRLLKEASTPSVGEALVKSRDFLAYRDFMGSNMYWKHGSYDFELALYLHTQKRPAVVVSCPLTISQEGSENLRPDAEASKRFALAYFGSLDDREGRPGGVAGNWITTPIERFS